MKKIFRKTLSANDVGATGTHQAGILVPKANLELLEFFPKLSPEVKNPDAWLECVDANGVKRKFRFVYYNNKLHDCAGTRNEYRITYMTSFFRDSAAKEGDVFEIGLTPNSYHYDIRVLSQEDNKLIEISSDYEKIKIKTGWRKIH
jgi:hypothetical protein